MPSQTLPRMRNEHISVLIGCSRSGTSLIRFICEAHSDISCLSDEEALPNLAGSLNLELENRRVIISANSYLDSLPLVISHRLGIVTTRRDPLTEPE